jgi:hypothetical protein
MGSKVNSYPQFVFGSDKFKINFWYVKILDVLKRVFGWDWSIALP